MNKSLRRALIISAVLGSFSNLQAMSTKAEKFFSILEKKPESEFLFDRFYDLYMLEATAADLEKLFDDKYNETKDSVYLQLKAALFEEESETGKALELYDQLVDDNSSAFLVYKRGFLKFSELDFKGAIKDLELAATKSPSEKLRIKIGKLLGKIYIREMETEKGLSIWLKLVNELDDENLAEEVLELMIGEGLYDQAQKQIELFIKSAKNNHRKISLMLRRGDLYRKQDQKDKALEMYSGSLEMVGAGSWVEKEILSQIEQVFRAEDDLNGLSEFYTELLKVRKNNIQMMTRQAQLFVELGDVEEADKLFVEIIKLTPENRENRELYSDFLVKQEKYKKALVILNAMHQEQPTDGELLISMANLQYKLKNSMLCLELLTKYNELNKNSELALGRTAELLLSYEMKAEALVIYDKLVKLFPENREAKLMRAYVLYDLDKKADALTEYEALSKSCNIEELQNLMMILNGVEEYDSVDKILNKRNIDFSTEYKFQQLRNKSAVNLGDKDAQYVTAEAMVKTASSFSELKMAVDTFIYTAKRQEKSEELFNSLKGKEKLMVNETILLSELLYKEKPEESLALLNKLAEKENGKLMALQQILLFQKAEGNWNGAIETLTTLSKAEPKSRVKYLTELVDVCLNDEKTEKALSFVEEWKKASPSATGPYLKEAQIYRTDGQNEKGIEVLKKAMFKFQDDKELPKILASNLANDGDFRSARSIYWNQLGKSEELSEKLSYVALLKSLSDRDGSIDQLIAKLTTRMENNPKSVFPLLALAEVSRYHDYEARRDYLIKATELRTKDTSLLREIARIEDEEGRYDQALATLKKIHEIDKDASSKQGIVSFYLKNGEDEQAMSSMMEPVKGKSVELDEVVKIAESMLKTHSPLLDKFITPFYIKNPDDYRFVLLKALALMDLGKEEKAAELFISAMSLPDKNPPKEQAKATQNRYNSYITMMFDQKTADFIMKHNFFETSNYYWQLQNRQRNGLTVPTKFKEVKPFAMSCALMLIHQMETKNQDEFLELMSRNGLSYADIHFLSFKRRGNQIISKDIVELKKKYIKSPEIVNYLTLIYLDTVKDQDEFDELIKYVKETNPRLLPRLLQRYGRNSLKISDEEVYSLAVSELLKMPRENFFHFPASLLSSDKITPELRKKLSDRVKELFIEKDSNQHASYMKNTIMIQVLLNEDNYEELVQVFNLITEEFHKGLSAGHHYYGHHYGRHSSKLFPALNFDSLITSKIDNQLKSIIPNSQSRHTYYYGVGDTKKVEAEKLAPHVEMIKDPMLKFYIYSCLKDNENAQKTADEIIKTLGKKDLSSFKLFTAWYIQNAQFEKAVDTLDLAILTAKQQKGIKELSALALFYSSKSKVESYKKSAKKYSDRLLKLKLKLEEKGEVAGYLATLGYVEEASQLETQIRQALKKKVQRTSSRSSSRSRTQNTRDKIRKLFDDKKYDEAIKLSTREYRKLVRPLLVVTNNNNNNSWELRNIFDYVKRSQKVDEFLAALKPANDTTSTRSLIEYAYANQFFGKKDVAIEFFKKALVQNENHRAANLYLGILLAVKGEDGAFKMIKKAVGSDWSFAAQILYNQVNQNSNSEAILDFIPVVTEFIKELNQDKSGMVSDLWNINNSISNFERNIYINSVNCNIPHILNPKQKIEQSDETKRKKAEAIRDKRRELCLTLYKEAIKHPIFSSSSFGNYNEMLRRNDVSLEERVRIAKESLTSISEFSGHHHSNSSSSHSFDGKELKLETQKSLLISYAFSQNKYDEIMAFAKTISLPNYQIKEDLELLKPLYEAPEDKFVEVAETFLDEKKDEAERMNKTFIPLVIKVYEARKFKNVSLTDLVLKTFKKQMETLHPHRHFDSSYLKNWISVLESTDDIVSTKVFVGSLFKEWLKHVKSNLDDKYPDVEAMRQDQLWWRLENPFRIISDSCSNVELMSLLFMEIASSDSKALTQMVKNSNLSWRFRDVYEKVCRDVEKILTSQLCAELNQFDPIINPVSDRSENASALAVFVSRVKNYSQHKKTIKEGLEKSETKTFGIQLLLKILDGPKVQDVYTFMDSQLEQFKLLPKEKQTKFVTALSTALKVDYNFRRDLKKVTGTFSEFTKADSEGVLQAKYETFIKKSMGNSEYQYRNDAAEVIGELADDKPDLAQKAFDRAAEVLNLYYLKNISRYQNSSYTPLTSLIDRLDDSMTEGKAKLILQNLDKVSFPDKQRKYRMLGSVISNLRYHAYGKNDQLKEDREYLAVKFFVEHFPMDQLGGYSVSSVVESVIRNADEENCTKILALEQVKNAVSDEMKELKILTTYYLNRRKDRDAAVSPDFIAFYTTFLKDEKRSMATKASALEVALYPINDNKADQVKEISYLACGMFEKLTEKELDALDDDIFEALVISLSQVKDVDEKWRKAAEGIFKLMNRFPEIEKSNDFKIRENYTNTVALGIFDLYLRIGKIDKAKSLMANSERGFSKVIESYLLLAIRGYQDEAAMLFADRYMDIKPTSRKGKFTKKLLTHEVIDAFISKLEFDEQIQLLAKMYVESNRGNYDKFEDHFITFEAFSISDVELKKKFVYSFFLSSRTSDYALKYADLFFENYSPKKALKENDSSFRRFYANHLLGSLKTLSSEKLTTILDEIVEYTNNNDNRQSYPKYLSRELSGAFMKYVGRDETKELSDKFIQIGKMISKVDEYYSNLRNAILGTSVIIYCKNDPKVMNDWLSSLNKDKMKRISKNQYHVMWNYMKKLPAYEKADGTLDRPKLKAAKADLIALLSFKKKAEKRAEEKVETTNETKDELTTDLELEVELRQVQ